MTISSGGSQLKSFSDSDSTGKKSPTDSEAIRLPTATMHVIFAVLLVSLVGYVQHYFSFLTENNRVTVIGQKSDDQLEVGMTEADPYQGLAQMELAEVITLADSIEERLIDQNTSKENARQVLSNFFHQSSDRQWRIAWFVLDSLLKREDYQHADLFASLLSPQNIKSAGLEFEMAIIALRIGKRKQSIHQFQELLSRNPANAAAAINLGRLLLEDGAFKQAEQVINDTLTSARGEKRSKILTLLSDLQYEQKQYKNAVKTIEKAIEFRPSVAYLWRRKAIIEWALKDYPAATKSFEQALSLNKDSKITRRLFADLLLETFQFYPAYRQLNRLFKSNRGRTETAINSMGALWYSGRVELVNKQSKRYQEKSKSARVSLIGDALLDFSKEQWRKGQLKLKQTLKKNRDNNLAYLLIAQSYLALKKPKNANVYLDKIKSGSRWFSLSIFYMIKSTSLIAGGNDDRSSKNASDKIISVQNSNNTNKENTNELNINSAVTKDNKTINNTRAYSELIAQLPLSHFDLRTSQELLDDLYLNQAWIAGQSVITALSPMNQKNRRIRLLQAKFNWRSGNSNLAISQLKLLLEDEKAWPAALYRLAGYYRQLGQITESDATYQRLLSVDPEYSDAGWQAARVKEMMSDYEAVIGLLEPFTIAHPAHLDSRLLLAKSECEINHIQQCRSQLDLLVRMSPNNRTLKALLGRYSTIKKNQ